MILINTPPQPTSQNPTELLKDLLRAHGAKDQTGETSDQIKTFISTNPKVFNDYAKRLFSNNIEQFLQLQPFVEWTPERFSAVCSPLKHLHIQSPELVVWMDQCLQQFSSKAVPEWRLQWAVLNRRLPDLLECLAHNPNQPLDDVFLGVISVQDQETFEALLPYARATLRDPSLVWAQAHDVSERSDNPYWIDRILACYSEDELIEEMETAPVAVWMEPLRNYIVQHLLRDLSTTVAPKKRLL